MLILTEPVGSIPKTPELLEALASTASNDPPLNPLYAAAIGDTIDRFTATGSPVITDGEQRKYHNFWTYCVHGLPSTTPDGFKIPFAAGHTRRMPRLTRGPFRYMRYADSYLDTARQYTQLPLKQAVISPPALSLMYPADGIADYSREQFIDDLLREHETEVRRCLDKGAHKVQIDFTEARLAMKIDPRIETPEQVCQQILDAARYIPLEQLGTTDDCGFSPFSDDTSTSRHTAFAKIRTRVAGTALAAERLGGGG